MELLSPDDCIFHLLAKASQAGTRYWKSVVGDLGVTAVQAKVLVQLNGIESIGTGDLSRLTALDSATLTGVLDRLEKMTLITRTPKPEDRRALSIQLTAKGAQLATTLYQRMPQANADFLEPLSDSESALLRNLLKRL
ncbi:MAG: MarR family transcriptional regulator [Candidatus Pelagadaptatus aseana]|uniref:MarR family winged helix-turn-helix transcriptional regulator n=1 Tax=Candidatus Pelagadaptatus aseana TaxID=3120508 RepID=UPI0039B2F314